MVVRPNHKIFIVFALGLLVFFSKPDLRKIGSNVQWNEMNYYIGDKQDDFQKIVNGINTSTLTAPAQVVSQIHVRGIKNNEVNSKILTSQLNVQEAMDEEKITLMHWNESTRINPPSIYHCALNGGNGYREVIDLMKNVLPEYIVHDMSRIRMSKKDQRMPMKYFESNYTNEYDVFIINYFQTCDANIQRWLLTHFNGHIIFFSGESLMYPIGIRNENERAHKLHVFGPSDNERKGDIIIRYFQMTWWYLFQKMLPQQAMVDPDHRPRSTKANFTIYGNSNCVRYREEAVGRLSELGVVHYDGKCGGVAKNRSNFTKVNNGISLRNWWDNIKLYKKYRFCFVMEHVRQRGYMSEKIIMAFIGGCIPIYYGSEEIFHIFNKNSFVFYNISDPEPALDLVKRLEENETRYEEMMREPIAANGNKTIEEYFSFNDTIGNGLLKRIIREKLDLVYLVP